MNVMGNLSNPEALGPMIAAAFVATLWGVMAANFWFLPMGAKILRVSELQAAQMELLVEGIAEIQARSEEHTSELQSRQYLVCRLLLEKKMTDSASAIGIALYMS